MINCGKECKNLTKNKTKFIIKNNLNLGGFKMSKKTRNNLAVFTTLPAPKNKPESKNEPQFVTCSFCKQEKDPRKEICVALDDKTKTSGLTVITLDKRIIICAKCSDSIHEAVQKQRLLRGTHPAEFHGETDLMKILKETPEEGKEREEKERKKEELLPSTKPSDE